MLNPVDRALQTQGNRGSELSFAPREQRPTGAHPGWPSDQTRYRALGAESVIAYLAGLEWIAARLGADATRWQAHERGDGNLNLVFFVQGPAGAVVVKQALPYVRMVGESWPLSLARNFFEHTALREQARWAAEFVPAVLHTDEVMALMVMELLSPHVVLRKGLIAAHRFPNVGRDLGRFLARTLVNTSDLRLGDAEKKSLMSVFLANTAMCKISEDVVFDEPYFAAPFNRHTTPQLDDVALALARDTELKVAVQAMKSRFMNQPECLVHGDLHTGSVMVTDFDTRVIDAEFAFYCVYIDWKLHRVGYTPVADVRGWNDLLLGDHEAAKLEGQKILDFLEKTPETRWNGWYREILRADAQLFMGDVAAAKRTVDAALALTRGTPDVSDQMNATIMRVRILAWSDDKEEAVKQLAELSTSVPGLWPGEIGGDAVYSIPLAPLASYRELTARLSAQMRASGIK